MPTETRVIWDRFIRLSHWLVASLVILNYFFTNESGDIHEYAGYLILVVVVMRIIWGFIGPTNARFKSFFPYPSKIKQHLSLLRKRQFEQTEGHNPVGGLMVLFLIITLFITSVSGWMLEWEIFWGEEWLETTHEIAANMVLSAAMVHLLAILFLNYWLRTNFIKTMVTGKRNIKH